MTITADTKGLIACLMIALTSCFIGCSTASAQSLTPDEVRTILKLESSYQACKAESSLLSRKVSAYVDKNNLQNAQIKNYKQILTNQAEVELNLQQTVVDQQALINTQSRQLRLFKTGLFVSAALIPVSLIAGAIYLP